MFAKSYQSNRFNNVKELKSLQPILKDLHHKEIELRKLVNDDAAHPIYRKSIILTQLTKQLNNIISQFNTELAPEEKRDELIQLITLIAHLKNTVILTLNTHRNVLNTARSSLKEIAPQVTGPAALTGTIGVGIATGSFLFALAPVAAKFAVDYVADKTGLYNTTTATVLILEHFINTLHTIDSSLRFVIKDAILEQINNPQVFLCCPITLQKMRHPVLCSLDGRMYEKKAISKWLQEKKSSPFNRKALAPNQDIDTVLIDNIALEEALDELEYLQTKPTYPLPSAPPFEGNKDLKLSGKTP